MSKMSDYLEKKLLDHVLRNTPFTSPTKVYLGLFTSNPTDADVGDEVSAGEYERQEISFGAASTPGGASANNEDIMFPIAESNWGTVTHLGIYDAKIGGNLLLHGSLNAARTINIDNQLIVLVGNLTVVFD